MPGGRPSEYEEKIEEWTAEILEARSRIIDLDLLIREWRRRGAISEGETRQVIEWLNVIFVGNVRGQQCAKWVRRGKYGPGATPD